MFNLGFSEILILGVIALIFIGPKKLPELARTVGRLLNECKRATSDFQNTFTASIDTHIPEIDLNEIGQNDSAQEGEVQNPESGEAKS